MGYDRFFKRSVIYGVCQLDFVEKALWKEIQEGEKMIKAFTLGLIMGVTLGVIFGVLFMAALQAGKDDDNGE